MPSFLVELPLAGGAPAGESRDDAPQARVSRRVLVVEDNRDEAESLRDALELAGHEVVVVHDGAQAVARAIECRPDVVLCDIGLPVMDGYEVARRIRGRPRSTPRCWWRSPGPRCRMTCDARSRQASRSTWPSPRISIACRS